LPSSWFWTLAVLGSFGALATGFGPEPPTEARRRDAGPARRRRRAYRWRHFVQATFSSSVCPTRRISASTQYCVPLATSDHAASNYCSGIRLATRSPSPHDFVGSFQAMWIGPAIAVVAAIALTHRGRSCWGWGTHPGLWCVSPVVAWWLSWPRVRHRENSPRHRSSSCESSPGEPGRFFETFVGPTTTGCRPTTTKNIP